MLKLTKMFGKTAKKKLTVLALSLLLVIAAYAVSYAAARLLMEVNPGIVISDLEVSDYDQDGVSEIIASNANRRVYLFENNGSLVYQSNQLAGTAFQQLISVAPQPGSPEYALLITDTQRGYFNVSAKAAAPVWTTNVQAGWTYLVPADVGDLNGDGLYDVATGRYRSATNVIRVHVIRAVNGTNIAETGNLAGNLDSIILERLRAVIYDDIVFSSTQPRFYIYRFNAGTGGITQAASVALTVRYALLAAVNDINGDGVKDIACARYNPNNSSQNGLDIRSGASGALLASLVLTMDRPVSIVVSDLDLDGRDEVVIGTSGASSRFYVFKTGVPIQLLYSSSASSQGYLVKSSDFDYDGKPDFIAQSGTDISLVKYDPQADFYQIAETTSAVSGGIDLAEKLKARQFNGGAAEDIVFANSSNTQLKAITFYTPPAKVVSVYNRKVQNTEVSAGSNYLLDELRFSANYDGVLNSIRYTYSGQLNPVYITALKIYKDNGDAKFNALTDTLLGSTTIQNGYAVFNLNLPFVSDAENILYLAADIRSDVPPGNTFKLSIAQPSDFYAPTFETTGTFPIETADFITVDVNTPIVFIQPSIPEPDGENGWYRSSLTIGLSMNKLGLIWYKWNNDPFKVYNGAFTPPIGINTLYCYAVDLYGNRSTTKTLTVKVDLTPPEVVRGFQVEERGPQQVQLVWRPSLDKQPGSGLSRYEIFRNGVLIATVSGNQTSYTDLNVLPLTSYRYKVRAVDNAGNRGCFSEEIKIKTGPAPLKEPGINIVSTENSNIIFWESIASTQAAYVDVYRSEPHRAKNFIKITQTPLNKNEGYYEDLLQPGEIGKKYYYKLVILDLIGRKILETKPKKISSVNVEKAVGSEGGIVTNSDSSVKLNIPPGSISKLTTVTISSTSTTFPAGLTLLSDLYDISPDGLTLSQPATLILSFKTNKSIQGELIRIGSFSGGSWSFASPDELNLSSGTASIRISHFSIYGVFYLSEGIDIEPPKIEKVRSASPSKTFVTFSEFIDTSSVASALFEINDTSVTTFYPFKDGKTVVVDTLYMDPQTPREIYVSGIRDLAGNLIPEDGVSNVSTFTVVPTPHGRYLDDTNKCSLCHSVHYGKNSKLLVKETATEVCYICHDSSGSGSKYATQSWFEDPSAVSIHHTRYGDNGVYCTDCHSPHKDVGEVPSLLRVKAETSETTGVPERFCFACHGASVSTLPAYLRIKEASYTAGIHFETLPGPPSGNGITCLQCHMPHASVQPTLMRGGTEEYVCIICHKQNGVSPNGGEPVSAPDVLSSILTAPEATFGLPGFPSTRTVWYKHPTIEYSGRHTLAELFDATEAAQSQATTETRHAECEDCHNSHYAKQTIYREPPYAPLSLLGAAGVRVTYPYQTTEPVYTWEPYGNGVTYEYEVCLRCHSGFAKAWYGTDLAKLFSPYNGSFHPVITIGKNQTTAMANGLLGFTPQSQILCSDCHSAADPTYPRGPHGSIYPFILSANYRFELKPQSATDDFDTNDFALCFKCHSPAPFLNATGVQRNDTNFRWHGYHLRRLYNNPGRNTVDGGILTPGAGKGNAICRECHYNPHGSSLGRLVKFSPNVLPTGGRTEPVFVQKTSTSNGYCLLRCHGRGHGTGMSY